MQPHHVAREVFLSKHAEDQEAACLLRPAAAVPRREFATAEGDDVFLLEYEYDAVWQVRANARACG